MGADLGALLDHDHAELGRQLLQPDRGGKPGRAGADDDDVELHGLAGGHIVGHGVLVGHGVSATASLRLGGPHDMIAN